MSAATCVRCSGPVQSDRHTPCCSSHGKTLCCECYSRTHFVETGCCGPEFARKKPAESRVHTQHDAALADFNRVRDELRDRLTELSDADKLAAFDWLAQNKPDEVNEALLETGAPE